jgi:ATP-binding cassette subfamily B protein
MKYLLELPYSNLEKINEGRTREYRKSVQHCEKFITSVYKYSLYQLSWNDFLQLFSLLSISYKVTLVYFIAIPIISFIRILSKKIKVVQKSIVSETTALCWLNNRNHPEILS